MTAAAKEEKLSMIDRAKEALRRLGLSQCRVRHHGEIAQVEIARDEMTSALNMDTFDAISLELKRVGFRYVAVDADGYRSGALNESLTLIETTRT